LPGQRLFTQGDIEDARMNGDRAAKMQYDAFFEFLIHPVLSGTFIRVGSTPNNHPQHRPVWNDYVLLMGRLVNGQPDGLCELRPYTGIDRHGIIQSDSNGDFIMGYFSNGLLSGRGIIQVRNNGRIISSTRGIFVDGVLHGVANIETADYGLYKGALENGLFHGLGCFTDTLGNIWEGEFADGELLLGLYFDKTSGIHYYGYFENWMLQGLGYIQFDLDIFIGDFKDGEMVALLDTILFTSEEKTQIRAERAASNVALVSSLMAISNESENRIRQQQANTQQSIDTFRNNLIQSQPPPRWYSVPSYGTRFDHMRGDPGWVPWVFGN
jgi:hypothetical protein